MIGRLRSHRAVWAAATDLRVAAENQFIRHMANRNLLSLKRLNGTERLKLSPKTCYDQKGQVLYPAVILGTRDPASGLCYAEHPDEATEFLAKMRTEAGREILNLDALIRAADPGRSHSKRDILPSLKRAVQMRFSIEWISVMNTCAETQINFIRSAWERFDFHEFNTAVNLTRRNIRNDIRAFLALHREFLYNGKLEDIRDGVEELMKADETSTGEGG